MLNVLDGLLAEFPFNWFPLREGSPDDEGGAIRFYFSGFPFNWFPLREGSVLIPITVAFLTRVSIQLVSPARGEMLKQG